MKQQQNQMNNNSLKNLFKNIVENSKIWIIAPIAILLAGIIVFATLGFNLGIDFTGGTVIEISAGNRFNVENSASVKQQFEKDVTQVLSNNSLKASYYQIQGEGDNVKVIVRYQDVKGKTEEQMEEISAQVVTELIEKLNLNTEDVSQSQRIGATASGELIVNCMLAILVAVILMLIYIAIRFELSFGLSAIFALIHDVMIMLSLMAIFRIQMNAQFVAALITIIGYSINNTIVIFDRIRDNKKREIYNGYRNATITNISVKETLTRTIYTTITTLLAIVLLAILGVSSIREFALPIIFGLCAGTYSSIFLAGSLWAIINDNTVRRREKKVKTQVNN